MKCPHCLVEYHDKPNAVPIGTDGDGDWGLVVRTCPNCNRLVIELSSGQIFRSSTRGPDKFQPNNSWLVRPKCPSRNPLSSEVPKDISSVMSSL